MILFDFECGKCRLVFEELVPHNVRDVVCPCGYLAKRLVSAPRIDPRLGVNADSFPTMGDKWARVREQRAKIESKRAREHGED